MNPLNRLPGPGPRGERGGVDLFHFVAAFFGVAIMLLAVAAVVLLLWNSFKVRTEVRALRNEVARLGSAAGAATAVPGAPAAPVSAAVNTKTLAVPPAPAAKTPRAPRKKPSDSVE